MNRVYYFNKSIYDILIKNHKVLNTNDTKCLREYPNLSEIKSEKWFIFNRYKTFKPNKDFVIIDVVYTRYIRYEFVQHESITKLYRDRDFVVISTLEYEELIKLEQEFKEKLFIDFKKLVNNIEVTWDDFEGMFGRQMFVKI